MRIYSFFATIHQDRFDDLAAIVGEAVVTMEPYSFGGDNTYEVYISGAAEVSRKLDRVLQGVKHILSSAPVFEVV